jgi:16S rRNA G966 N2-methylase RsmD
VIEAAENTALAQINEGRRQLALAGDDIQAIATLRDKAMAAQIFAAAQGYKEAAQEAKIFQLQAERKAGEWLEENVSEQSAWLQDATTAQGLPEGVDKYESSRWQLEAALPEEAFNEWVDNCLAYDKEISASALRGVAKNYLRQEARAEVAEKAESVQPSDRWHIYHADMQEWQAPKQYDFIITDPPYPKEYLHLYEVLAYRAVQWLKPGGLLIAMCGQSYLDEIYAMMGKHLKYYWTAAYLTPGQPTPLRQRNVNTTWKPLLIYSHGEYRGKIFGDVFKSDGNDKDLHKWGQSVSGMYDIISKICLTGQSILDPFCGAGTTGIAALKHDCLFDGIDIDEQNVKIAIGRLGSDSTA